jgi:hypothetical protein
MSISYSRKNKICEVLGTSVLKFSYDSYLVEMRLVGDNNNNKAYYYLGRSSKRFDEMPFSCRLFKSDKLGLSENGNKEIGEFGFSVYMNGIPDLRKHLNSYKEEIYLTFIKNFNKFFENKKNDNKFDDEQINVIDKLSIFKYYFDNMVTDKEYKNNDDLFKASKLLKKSYDKFEKLESHEKMISKNETMIELSNFCNTFRYADFSISVTDILITISWSDGKYYPENKITKNIKNIDDLKKIHELVNQIKEF